EGGSVYEALAQAYLAKEDKPAAVAELERYVKVGGRSPDTIQLLAKHLAEAGKKKEAAAVLDRLNFVYPMVEKAHQELGALWLESGNAAGAVREFGAVAAYKPTDPAQAHYNLASAYRANHQIEQAKDELVAALEVAPGFRQAQKMLLE